MEMDIFEQIHNDHELVGQHFEKMQRQPNQDREEMHQQLMDMLLPHAKAEELVLYAALVQFDEARLPMLKATEEHATVVLLLNNFDDAFDDTERFVAKVMVLLEMIQRHVEEEESHIFNLARTLLSREQLHDAGRRFREDKRRYQEEWRQAA